MVVGCTDTPPTYANPSSPSNQQRTPIPTKAIDAEGLATATHASVMSLTRNWDADAEDDGLVFFVTLKDANDQTVEWDGVSLPVDLEIWTTKWDSNYREQKDQLVYRGAGTMDSWEDGNFILGKGIRVPVEDMNIPSGKGIGLSFLKIHTPDGKTFEAKDDITSLIFD